MIAIVAVEAMLDITCPLTRWEDELRQLAGNRPAANRSWDDCCIA